MEVGRGHHRRQTVSAWRALREQPEELRLVPWATGATKERGDRPKRSSISCHYSHGP